VLDEKWYKAPWNICQINHHHNNSNSNNQQSNLLFHFYFNLLSLFDTYFQNNIPNNTINMQFTTILASTILAFASGISAAPTAANQVTIRIFNDQTGINSDATIVADNTPHPITELFAGTAIGNAGFVGTSAQLTQFTDAAKCQLVNHNGYNWVIELDGRSKNFVDLDGDVTKPVPTWLGGFSFQCSHA
jgi:hypothetical protein